MAAGNRKPDSSHHSLTYPVISHEYVCECSNTLNEYALMMSPKRECSHLCLAARASSDRRPRLGRPTHNIHHQDVHQQAGQTAGAGTTNTWPAFSLLRQARRLKELPIGSFGSLAQSAAARRRWASPTSVITCAVGAREGGSLRTKKFCRERKGGKEAAI